MSNVYYTSDLHLNHPFVAGTRGYTSAEEHDENLIAEFNRKITKSDSLWILGDLFMGSMTLGLPKVARLNGTKHLILGNHDAGHPSHKRSHTQLRRYMDVFETVQLHDQHRIDGHDVMLSHHPYQGDHKPVDRDTQWRLRDEGKWIIHGHVHAAWALQGRQLNVGVDQWTTPIDRDYVTALINAQTNHQPTQ